MKKFIVFLLFISVPLVHFAQSNLPDLSIKEDLEALGIGKIFETDNTTIRNVQLFEIKEFWIVYIKNESLHDILIDKIAKIEFLNSKWGRVIITFKNNKPEIKINPN
ncbi:MAG: hypothetical protein HUU47_07545 [Bacteroidetes bacterium]|nr:hypothetical protein [Bacteroidota bacterium]